MTPWETVGSVLTLIDDATGRGVGDPEPEQLVKDATQASSYGAGLCLLWIQQFFTYILLHGPKSSGYNTGESVHSHE